MTTAKLFLSAKNVVKYMKLYPKKSIDMTQANGVKKQLFVSKNPVIGFIIVP